MKAKRETTTTYKFNPKHGGFQPTTMKVVVYDTVETDVPMPAKPKDEDRIELPVEGQDEDPK
jgi:hypothetical protein